MRRIKEVEAEYQRLKSLFADFEKIDLIDSLIQQAAFMRIQLEVLQRQIQDQGLIQISSKGRQRQTEAAKYYTKLVANYSAVIKNLSSILGKNIGEGADEFDAFLQQIK